jgi:hypothetical protein
MTGARGVAPDLAWLLEVLWSRDAVAEQGPDALAMRVIPSAGRARALVPLDREVAARGLRAGGGTRSRRVQRTRSLAAALVRVGVFRDRIWIGADDPLRRTIEEIVAAGPLHLACAVRSPGSFRKPVIQVARADGHVVAYAKVAWNAVTAANVHAEHGALVALEASGERRVRAPRAIGLGEHRGFPLLLTEPMPPQLRRYDPVGPPPDPRVSLAIGPLVPGAAMPDPIGARLRRRLAATGEDNLVEVRDATTQLLEALGDRTAAVPAGAWHGDWSPWNLGWVGDELWAWDWEYCRPDTPIGLDIPHLLFQRRFIADRAPLDRAFADAAAGSAEPLSALGYGAADRPTVHAVHVAEIALRYLEAATLGVAANPRFVAGAIPALGGAIDAIT